MTWEMMCYTMSKALEVRTSKATCGDGGTVWRLHALAPEFPERLKETIPMIVLLFLFTTVIALLRYSTLVHTTVCRPV